MPSGETLTDQNGTPIGTNTNPMFATFIDAESGDKVKTSGTTLTGIDGNVQGTTANPLIVKIQDGTTPVDPNPMKVSGTTLTDTYGEPIGTNANPLILKALGGTGGKKTQMGQITNNTNTIDVFYSDGTSGGNWNSLQVSTPFKPSLIIITRLDPNYPHITTYQNNVNSNFKTDLVTVSPQSLSTLESTTHCFKGNSGGIVVNSNGFVLPVFDSTKEYYYIAVE